MAQSQQDQGQSQQEGEEGGGDGQQAGDEGAVEQEGNAGQDGGDGGDDENLEFAGDPVDGSLQRTDAGPTDEAPAEGGETDRAQDQGSFAEVQAADINGQTGQLLGEGVEDGAEAGFQQDPGAASEQPDMATDAAAPAADQNLEYAQPADQQEPLGVDPSGGTPGGIMPQGDPSQYDEQAGQPNGAQYGAEDGAPPPQYGEGELLQFQEVLDGGGGYVPADQYGDPADPQQISPVQRLSPFQQQQQQALDLSSQQLLSQGRPSQNGGGGSSANTPGGGQRQGSSRLGQAPLPVNDYSASMQYEAGALQYGNGADARGGQYNAYNQDLSGGSANGVGDPGLIQSYDGSYPVAGGGLSDGDADAGCIALRLPRVSDGRYSGVPVNGGAHGGRALALELALERESHEAQLKMEAKAREVGETGGSLRIETDEAERFK